MRIELDTLRQVFADFRWQERRARYLGELHGGDPTLYGEGVRVVSSNPSVNWWRVVSDPHWPLNINAHLVLPDGRVIPASSPLLGKLRHDITKLEF